MASRELPSRTEASRFSHYTYALVIGISDYADVGLDDLPACEREAQALASTLTDPDGCAIPADQVLLVPQAEATTETILTAFEQLRDAAGASDVLILYFAGHGVIDGNEFVLCTGAREDRKGITATELDDALRKSNARGILVIVDCCGGAALAENAPTFFYSLEQSDFRLFISASRSRQSSWELPEGRGSLFTQHLLRILNGDVGGSSRGEIFFTDLFDHLHTAVQSEAERIFGSRDMQEPVFSGSFSKDPLLFLHKDRSLATIRVQTERVTRADLRRQVAVALLTVSSLVFLAIGGFWAFLEGQQHLTLERDQIALVHGHPELSGFGLPRTEWVYPLGPESLSSDSALEDDWVLSFSRSGNAENTLQQSVLPAQRAQLLLWQGRRQEARHSFLADPDQVLVNDVGYSILPDLVDPDDEVWLQERISNEEPNSAAALIMALARINQEAAARALRSSAVAESLGHQLNLLEVWQEPCTEPLQAWMDELLSRAEAAYTLPAIAEVAIRAGCRFPVDAAILASDRHLESAVYALRLTNPKALPNLRNDVSTTIKNDLDAGINVFDPALPAKHRMLAVRSAALARYLDGMPCFPGWVERFRNDVFDPLDQDGRLNALVAVARNCEDATVEIEVDVVALRIQLKIGARAPIQALHIRTAPELNATIVPVLDALNHAGAAGQVAALTAIINQVENADLRIHLVERLRRAGADGSNALDYALPNQLRLERSLFLWLAASRPEAASARLRERIIETRDMKLVEALAFVELYDSDREELIAEAKSLGAQIRVATIALVGHAEEVAVLFLDPDPTVRDVASTYAPLNRHWQEIAAIVESKSRRADPFLSLAKERVETAKSLVQSLERAPTWAREWRAKWIDHSTIRDPGVALLFECRRSKGPCN